MKRTMKTRVGLILCLSLVLSMFSGVSGTAKKVAKIKKIEVRTTDSGVLVMKKKERKTLKLALNGKVSKTAWKKLKFRSKNKKVVRVNKKGKLTAKKKGSSKIIITAKGSKKKVLKVIVGTKVQSIRMNTGDQTLQEGERATFGNSCSPKGILQKDTMEQQRYGSSGGNKWTSAGGQGGNSNDYGISYGWHKEKSSVPDCREKGGQQRSFAHRGQWFLWTGNRRGTKEHT